ncbi:GDP-mannose 4,6-dehydratase [Pedobacter jejuensis]|uniref:NAD-dependent epimerase/dehydratase family protein n=1 Tax=Pedobacter jejuensis TaxID=1268550 RepID=A0A3N0BWY4_9SPHI|nr:GDP-mannose 4,6-dehydratase [Pedobacter jejuensis]RNL53970.1 NAD-dependent epimerase/dehydratase family protein [Pedobacter jejuensis]
MKKILVTGGAGFIGSNLILKLLRHPENSVVCLDNYNKENPQGVSGNKKYVLNIENPNFQYLEGDIRDAHLLENIKGIDIIVHLAAETGVRSSLDIPEHYVENNIVGTQRLLAFAKNQHITQFVFASSSSVYGENSELPWMENNELKPISPYASTKISGESLGRVYSHLYGIRFIALRLFTVYGPLQRADLAICKLFDALDHNKEFSVYGDGNDSRDYTYVDDVTDAFVSAIFYQKSNFEIINVGSGKAVRLNEVIKIAESISGKKITLKFTERQAGDVRITCAAISKAKQLLNYNPKNTLLDGLTKYNDWLKLQ